MPRSRGFTLLELLITIAVVAVMAAIAVPSFRRAVQNNARDRVLDGLTQSFDYARNAALRDDQNVAVCPLSASNGQCGTDWNNGWIVATAPAPVGTAPAAAGTVVLMTHPALATSGPQLHTASGSTGVTFSGTGLVSGQDTFVVCDSRGPTAAKALEVATTGYVQVSQQAGQGPAGGALTCP